MKPKIKFFGNILLVSVFSCLIFGVFFLYSHKEDAKSLDLNNSVEMQKNEASYSPAEKMTQKIGVNKEKQDIFKSDVPDNFKYLSQGCIDIGDSFTDSVTNLQCTISSLEISDNIYNLDWTVEQLRETNIFVGEDKSLTYNEAINVETGQLPENVYFLSVGLIVKNLNSTDIDEGVGTNNFSDTLLYLVLADPSYVSGITLPYETNDSVDYWNIDDSQSNIIHIEPGETVQYRLGYIIDFGYTLENTFLASMPSLAPEVAFIPVSKAEWK